MIVKQIMIDLKDFEALLIKSKSVAPELLVDFIDIHIHLKANKATTHSARLSTFDAFYLQIREICQIKIWFNH